MEPVSAVAVSLRERQRCRVVGCGGGAHSLVPSGGAHPLFVPGEGDEQGKGQGRGEKGRGRIGGRGIPIGRPRRQKSEK